MSTDYSFVDGGREYCIAIENRALDEQWAQEQASRTMHEDTPPLAPDSDTERLLAEAEYAATIAAACGYKSRPDMLRRLCAKVRELQATSAAYLRELTAMEEQRNHNAELVRELRAERDAHANEENYLAAELARVREENERLKERTNG